MWYAQGDLLALGPHSYEHTGDNARVLHWRPIWECLCNTVSCSAPASDTHEEAQDVADP